MYQFPDPPPCFLKQPAGSTAAPVPLPFTAYLDEVILALPYWRSSDEAAAQAEELLEQIDSKVAVYVVRDSTLEALRAQMKLAESTLVQQNPQLVRPSIRYLRVVNNATKKKEDLPVPALTKELSQ